MWAFLKRLLGVSSTKPISRSRSRPIKTKSELARRLGLSVEELDRVEVQYRSVSIPKSSGGTRTLDIPNAVLRDVQRRILKKILAKLRVHPSAVGFERKKSIVDNARPHVGKAVVIKLDVVDFFGNTREDRVRAYFQFLGWDEDSVGLLTRWCTYCGGLPQGAPTSPRLSNLVNFRWDAGISLMVKARKGDYTRYADDLTISFSKDRPKRIRGVIQSIQKRAKKLGYTIHTKKKLRILRKHHRQQVTGLVVNEKLQLPRKTRRKLRAIEHYLSVGRTPTMTPAQLQGWKAFQSMVEQEPEKPRERPKKKKK